MSVKINLAIFQQFTESFQKKSFFIFLCFFATCYSNAQMILQYDKNGKVQNENRLKMKPDEVRATLSTNQKALDLYNAGRSKKTVGNVLLIGGSTVFITKLMVDLTTSPNYRGSSNGYDLDKRVSPTLYFIGGAMVLTAIPIKIGFSKKIENAIDVHNREVLKNRVGFKVEESYFLANASGMGVGFRF